jgi:hypothetical protein
MNSLVPRRMALPWAAAMLALLGACASVPRPSPIATSRLGVAKATGTVAPGVVQLEAGYSEAHQDQRTRRVFGETMLRVGLGPRTEARLGLSSYQHTHTPAATVEGRADASVAIKHRLHDLQGGLPAVAITVGSVLPTGSDRVSAGAMQPEAGIFTEWKLPAGFRAMAMTSYRSAVATDVRFGQVTLAGGARRALSSRAVAQLEAVHLETTREGVTATNQLRAGAAVRLTPSLQLDGWAGRSCNGGMHENLFGVGFATRW